MTHSSSDTPIPVTYDPAAFDVFSFEDAQRATLGGLEHDHELIATGPDRWIHETAYTVELIQQTIAPKPHALILDYGCGAGRISAALANDLRCRVIGADQSPAMMLIAARYVNNKQYRSVYHETVGTLGGRCDAAVCIFVLQHSICPDEDVKRIYAALKPGGKFLLINELARYVPTVEQGFIHDGVDIRVCVGDVFGAPVDAGRLDPTRVDPRFSGRTYWAVYQKEA